jgi:uncharacterized membrane protein
MKAYLSIILGLALLLAPLWTLSGFVTVPQYRTGTIADFATALIAGATLYGGVFVGVLVSRWHKSRRNGTVPFRTTFVAGMAGAMGAVTLALFAAALSQLVSTGRIMPAGETPALLPVLYIVGGILSAFIAAGAGLIAYGLGGVAKGEEPD